MDGTKCCLLLLTSKLPGSVSRSGVRPERSPVFACSGFPATWSPRLGGGRNTRGSLRNAEDQLGGWRQPGQCSGAGSGFLCRAGVMWQKGHSQVLSLGLGLSQASWVAL